MTNLDDGVEIGENSPPTLFRSALADRWDLLPDEVKVLHSVQDVGRFSGEAEVTRGTSLIARFAAWLFRFPPAAERVPLTVTITRAGEGEIWERNFGGRVFRSHCTPSPMKYRYRERFGPFNYELELTVGNLCLRFPVRRGWFLGLPMPRVFLPSSDSREFSENGTFHFDVSLTAPLGAGLIVRYRGSLRPDQ